MQTDNNHLHSLFAYVDVDANANVISKNYYSHMQIVVLGCTYLVNNHIHIPFI
jgi:hypothetical protein